MVSSVALNQALGNTVGDLLDYSVQQRELGLKKEALKLDKEQLDETARLNDAQIDKWRADTQNAKILAENDVKRADAYVNLTAAQAEAQKGQAANQYASAEQTVLRNKKQQGAQTQGYVNTKLVPDMSRALGVELSSLDDATPEHWTQWAQRDERGMRSGLNTLLGSGAGKAFLATRAGVAEDANPALIPAPGMPGHYMLSMINKKGDRVPLTQGGRPANNGEVDPAEIITFTPAELANEVTNYAAMMSGVNQVEQARALNIEATASTELKTGRERQAQAIVASMSPEQLDQTFGGIVEMHTAEGLRRNSPDLALQMEEAKQKLEVAKQKLATAKVAQEAALTEKVKGKFADYADTYFEGINRKADDRKTDFLEAFTDARQLENEAKIHYLGMTPAQRAEKGWPSEMSEMKDQDIQELYGDYVDTYFNKRQMHPTLKTLQGYYRAMALIGNPLLLALEKEAPEKPMPMPPRLDAAAHY